MGSVYYKDEATNFRVQIKELMVFCVYWSCNIVVGAKSGADSYRDAQRRFIIQNLKFIIQNSFLAPGKPPRFPLYLPAGKGRSPIAIGGCRCNRWGGSLHDSHFGVLKWAWRVSGKNDYFRMIAHGLPPRFELNSGGKSAGAGQLRSLIFSSCWLLF